jgi:mono/diheme cytochrome c family protein
MNADFEKNPGRVARRGRVAFWAGGGAFLAAVAVLVAVVSGVLPTGRGPAPLSAVEPDPALIAAGARIYADACASCHGANLEGQPDWRQRGANGRLPAPPHDETGHTWHHPDAFLFGATKFGVTAYAGPGYESDMPAFADTLTDAEINAAIAYIKSRWPEQIRARQAAVDAAARNQQ